MHVKGIAGEVKNVYIADKATLTFARLRQPIEDAIVFDLKHQSDEIGTEISGTITVYDASLSEYEH